MITHSNLAQAITRQCGHEALHRLNSEISEGGAGGYYFRLTPDAWDAINSPDEDSTTIDTMVERPSETYGE